MDRDTIGGTALEARFRITPHPDADCGVLESDERGEHVRQNQVRSGDGNGNDAKCRAAFTVPGTDRQEFVGSTVDGRCICPVFHTYECVWEFREFSGGELMISVTVPDRKELRGLVEDLRHRGATVSVQSIVPSGAGTREGNHRLFDVSSITEKQNEALRMAVEAGYYDNPRRVDLDQLASALGVSRSAVSQRLNAAESKLVREFMAGDSEHMPARRSSSKLQYTVSD